MLALVILGGVASFFISKREIPAKVAPARSIIFVTPIPRPEPKPIPELPTVYPQDKVEEKMLVQDPLLEKNPPPSQPVIATPPPGGLDSTANGKGPSIGPSRNDGTVSPDTVGNKPNDRKWDYYAAKVQTAIKDALGGNDQTKSAIFSMEIQVWADTDGRITQATLVGTSGNLTVDQAVKNQVLTGLKLPSPPPVEMPMPIHLRISALKPPAN